MKETVDVRCKALQHKDIIPGQSFIAERHNSQRKQDYKVLEGFADPFEHCQGYGVS